MRWRFILAAMAAFGTVTLLLAAGINLINYSVTTTRMDHMLAGILEFEQLKLSRPPDHAPRISEMPWAGGPEADFTTRFFAVHCNRDGTVAAISRDYISSVDENTILQYTKNVLDQGHAKGYQGEYRYLVHKSAAGTIIIFLNVSMELETIHSLFLVSLMIAFISLGVVFLLILLLSNRVIRPYMKNMERQKQFITDAGHELKTPLTSITTSADILAMEYEGNEWITNIQKQTVRITHLVNSLVALSRLDEETPFPEKTTFSLSDAAWETSEPFAALARAGKKAYTQHIEEHLKLSGDRSAIQQMLSILLDNAVRYTAKGGEILLDIFRKHNKLCIEVSNTCDLPKDIDLNRLFDRFYRPDESRSSFTGGTGIGLSMARAIAETHGGSITAARPDPDTILFRVLLP